MDKQPQAPKSRKVIRSARHIDVNHEVSWGNKKVYVTSIRPRPRKTEDDLIVYEVWGTYRPRGKIQRTSTSFTVREDRRVTIHNWIDPPKGES